MNGDRRDYEWMKKAQISPLDKEQEFVRFSFIHNPPITICELPAILLM